MSVNLVRSQPGSPIPVDNFTMHVAWDETSSYLIKQGNVVPLVQSGSYNHTISRNYKLKIFQITNPGSKQYTHIPIRKYSRVIDKFRISFHNPRTKPHISRMTQWPILVCL